MTEFFKGSGDRELATTMAMVHLLANCSPTRKWAVYRSHRSRRGAHLRYGGPVPQISASTPMWARTMNLSIRSSLLYYKEAKDGQILEEGITEAGAMSSFIAAGTSYSTSDINMVPFFFFYSMFGFQRIGDLIWAAGTYPGPGVSAGRHRRRTTLAGEGLQHQDGHSHILALANPSVLAYDPAFAFEIAVIVREGLRRMLKKTVKTWSTI
jgi:pyruvate dehydrogenase E1 component